MAIPQYIRPMAEVYQQRDIVQAATGEHLAACIVGANYDVYRYGKEDVAPHQFNPGTKFALEYEKNPLLDYALDTNSVSLYAENILAQLTRDALTCPSDTTDPMIVRAGTGRCFAKTAGAPGTLVVENYNVQIGDKVYVEDKTAGQQRYAYVISLVGAKVAASAEVTRLGSTTEDITLAGTYGGKQQTIYSVQVTEGENSTVNVLVTDSAGSDIGSRTKLDPSQPLTGLDLGVSGLTVTIPAAALAAGNAWQVTCVPEGVSTTVFDGITLSLAPVDISAWAAAIENAPTVPYNVTMTIYREYSGDFASDFGNTTAWELDQDETGDYVEVLTGVNMKVGNIYYPLKGGVGNLYASFRVRVIPDANEDIITIASVDDIEDNFGAIALENDMAFACSCCLKGSAGRPFYAVRVRATDTDGYMEAVKKTETNTAVYSFVALTEDLDTQRAIRDYNTMLSAPDVKRWRRLLVGVDFPGAYTVAVTDDDNRPLTATFTKSTTGSTYLMQLSSSMDFDLTNIAYKGATVKLAPGDIIRVNVSGAEYTIKSVLSEKELLLVNGPAHADSTQLAISIIKADSAANNREYVINCATALNSYRCSLVWADKAQAIVDGVYEVIPNKFIAAEIAGISSAVVPQKSITHTEIQSVTNASRMYTQYSQLDLDDIAKNGVMIITQDTKNTPCYIRHQLTTQTDSGLMFYEESFTRNYDNISYAVAEAIEPFIGKANVVASALTALHDTLIVVFNRFMQNSTDVLIGPALVSYDGLQVYQDPTFMDRVIIKVNYYLPAPLNNIKCYQMAYVAQVTI